MWKDQQNNKYCLEFCSATTSIPLTISVWQACLCFPIAWTGRLDLVEVFQFNTYYVYYGFFMTNQGNSRSYLMHVSLLISQKWDWIGTIVTHMRIKRILIPANVKILLLILITCSLFQLTISCLCDTRFKHNFCNLYRSFTNLLWSIWQCFIFAILFTIAIIKNHS